MKYISHKITDIREDEGNIDVEYTFDTGVEKHTLHYTHSSHDEFKEVVDEKGNKKQTVVLVKSPLFGVQSADEVNQFAQSYAQALIQGHMMEEQQKEAMKASDEVKALIEK